MTLAASFAALAATGPGTVTDLMLAMRRNLQLMGEVPRIGLEPHRSMIELLGHAAVAMAPLLLGAIVTGIAAQLIVTGMVFVPESLKPKWQRLNPLEKLKNWFSPRMAVELFKTLTKFVVLMWICNKFWNQQLLPQVQAGMLTTAALPSAWTSVTKLAWDMIGFLLVLGVADAAWQLFDYRKNLRMTKYEVKQEHKHEEGDPHIRARRRAMARKIARSLSLAGVKKADVVVTNPVHLAVALEYKRGMAAPKIVAKGADLLAARLKEMAREHEVPIVENKILARSLYPLELDEEIPEQLYKAVAEVLVSVAKVEDYL